MKIHLAKYIGIVFAITFVACSQKKDTPQERKENAAGARSGGETDIVDGGNDSGAAYLSLKLLDPSMAEVELVRQKPSLSPAADGSKLKVPAITIRRKQSDTVQILRCPSTYIGTTTLGDEVNNKTVGGIGRATLRIWWQQAVAAQSECKLLGNHITRKSIADITAPTGDWFYIINPCVSKIRSKTQTAGCSHRLQVTEVITGYENTSKAEFYEKASELAELEGQIAAAVETLVYNAKEMPEAIRFCEDRAIIKDIERRTGLGFKALASMAVGATVGAFMGGGVGAIQGANTALKIAGAVFKDDPPESEGCPKADKLYKESSLAYEDLDLLKDQVLIIREEMGELNSEYSSFNSTLKSDYISKPTNSYQGAGGSTGSDTDKEEEEEEEI